jgi:hypothetical protein
MPLSSRRSRRRWSRSWRRWVRCRRCSHGGSRSPPGGSRVQTASRPSCSRSGRSRRAGPGLLCRDGNGARSFETLLRYRGAAMAEFWCALRTLKALQAEPTRVRPVGASASRPEIVPRLTTNEPDRCPQHRLDTLIPEPGRGLHESPAIWQPNEPDPMPANPRRRLSRGPAHGRSDEPGLAGMRNEVGEADPGPQATPDISAAA